MLENTGGDDLMRFGMAIGSTGTTAVQFSGIHQESCCESRGWTAPSPVFQGGWHVRDSGREKDAGGKKVGHHPNELLALVIG